MHTPCTTTMEEMMRRPVPAAITRVPLVLSFVLPFALSALSPLSLALLALPSFPAAAQPHGIQRTVITRGDVSVPNREAVVAHVELAPGATAGRHTHPGDEISYFLDGEGELLVDGAPPRRVKAGEAIIIPAGVVHDARNPGTTTTKLVGVYIVEKGQPLATPAR
jgi:quercetin dioxygenase-like cupin family protein